MLFFKRKTPQEKAREKAQALLAEVQSLADIVNETVSPSIFFDKYKLLVEKLRELACYEWLGFFSNSPLEDLRKAQAEKYLYIHALIERCSEKLSSKCKTCETPSECRQLIEAFEDSFNDFAIELSDENIAYMQACADNIYNRYVFSALDPTANTETKYQSVEICSPQKKIDFDSYPSAFRNQNLIQAFCKIYDLSTAAGIRSIPAEEMQRWEDYSSDDVVASPSQILNRKATEYKKAGNLDLAIECLKKVNEIYPHSKWVYTRDNYMRLVRYLNIAGRFEEAQIEQEKIYARFGSNPLEQNPIAKTVLAKSIERAKEFGQDLLEASWVDVCCEICGKYRGRIFSISGKSKEFPKFPTDFCTICGVSCYPFYYGISKPTYYSENELHRLNQQPFIDTRTAEQKAAYNKKVQDILTESKDRTDYEWLLQFLPNVAPKSFGGYRRMKNSNSANFKKLKESALAKGREIG